MIRMPQGDESTNALRLCVTNAHEPNIDRIENALTMTFHARD